MRKGSYVAFAWNYETQLYTNVIRNSVNMKTHLTRCLVVNLEGDHLAFPCASIDRAEGASSNGLQGREMKLG